MRKINYSEPKLQELLETLDALGFHYTKTKESLDVSVDSSSKRVLGHELSRLNGLYKTPPIMSQFDEASKIVSLFDQRL